VLASRRPLAHYGFRRPRALRAVWWALPLAVIPLIVLLTLWVGIAWHIAYDFTSYLGGDALDSASLAGLALECAVLGWYAVVLWRRLPEATTLRGLAV